MKKRKLILDSGAYSASKPGVEPINIDEYTDFIKEYGHLFTGYFNLDCIDENITSIEKGDRSFENYQYMRSKGLNPIPVFHHGSDLKHLKYYLEHSDYLGLGNIADTGMERIYWLDYIFNNYLLDSNKKPILKVHGFGVTALNLLQRYPWHSVDSSTFIQTALFGKIHVPYYVDGKFTFMNDHFENVGGQFDYTDTRASTFFVTERSAKEAKLEQSYFYVRAMDKEMINLYLEQECNSSIDRVSDSFKEDFKERCLVNGRYFMEVNKSFPDCTIYFSVVATDTDQKSIVDTLKKEEILLSYFYIRDKEEEFKELWLN